MDISLFWITYYMAKCQVNWKNYVAVISFIVSTLYCIVHSTYSTQYSTLYCTVLYTAENTVISSSLLV